MKLCECGCGQSVAPNRRFLPFHHMKGKTNPRYKGGVYFAATKNRWVIICRDGSRVHYARAVMEAALKRHLDRNESVHHIDGDSTNDSPYNLQVMGRIEHNLISARRPYTPGQLLAYLRRFWLEHGRTPTSVDFCNDPTCPHPTTYRHAFGKWNHAIHLAKLPVVREARWSKS